MGGRCENYQIVKTPARQKYIQFLSQHPGHSYYHSLAYYDAIRATRGMTACFVAVVDSEGAVKAVTIGELANEIDWLPFTKRLIVYDKPLYTDDEDLFVLMSALSEVRSGLFSQIRTFEPFTEVEERVIRSAGFQRTNHLNAYIWLKGKNADDVFSDFKKDKRIGIRKASEKFGLVIKEPAITSQTIDEFYKIEKQLYKRKHHALKSRDYFGNLIKSSNGIVRLVLVYYNGKPIATRLYSVYNKRCTALYVAVLQECKSFHANDLLVWHAIQKGVESGCDVFDFGGGGNPDNSYGPRDYKARFNACFENVGRYNLPTSAFYRIVIVLYEKVLKR